MRAMRAARRLPLRDTNESYLRTKLWNSRGTGYRYRPPTMEMDSAGIGWPLQVALHSNIESARNVSTHATRNEDHECSFAPRSLGRMHTGIANRSANFRLGYVKTSHNVAATLELRSVSTAYDTLESFVARDVSWKLCFLYRYQKR